MSHAGAPSGTSESIVAWQVEFRYLFSLANSLKFTLTAHISWSSNALVGFFPLFFSQDYRLSSGNALAAGERWRKRTGVCRCIAGQNPISQTIDCTDRLATQQFQFSPLLEWAD
jgi:hypothetical protein